MLKLTVGSAAFKEAIGLALRAIPSRPSHPILGNFRLIAGDTGSFVLTSFDLSMGIEINVDADIETRGEITIPAKLLSDIVSRSEGLIELTIDEGSTLVQLKTRTAKYTIPGMETEEFPQLPEIGSAARVEISCADLAEALHGTLFSASGDETKRVLTGVNFALSEGRIKFAATDGHRLAVTELTDVPVEESLWDTSLTIPATALREVERIAGKQASDEQIRLLFDSAQVAFQAKNHWITCRKLEGDYPRYPQLIPTQFRTQVTIERRQLLGSLERVAVIADRNNNVVKFEFSPDGVKLSVDAADVGSGKELIRDAQVVGEPLTIAFNCRYVLASLQNLTSTEVQIRMNTPGTPAIITPLFGTAAIHLVMPVQIRG